MIWLRVLIVFLTFFLLMNIKVVQGIEAEGGPGQKPLNNGEIYKTVAGAVEDTGWMICSSKEEVNSFLGKYFVGFLLEETAVRTWDFIKEPTDWYSVARVVEMKILYSDADRAVAEAVIRIEDVDTGHTDFGKGLFAMIHTKDGWRINYLCFNWGSQAENR